MAGLWVCGGEGNTEGTGSNGQWLEHLGGRQQSRMERRIVEAEGCCRPSKRREQETKDKGSR